MAKYRVKVIKHLCKRNHIAKFGDEVDETQLTSNAADLVNAGFIELVEETDLKETSNAADLVNEKDSFDLDKMKVDELKDFAKINGIELTATKKDDIIEEIAKGLELLNTSDVNDSQIVE